MADKFCANCGNRLIPPGLFCAECGAPAGRDIEEQSPSLTYEDIRSERFGVTRRPKPILGPEENEDKRPYGVWMDDLNRLMACSFVKAPLDTEFLLLQNQLQSWIGWLPLSFIRSLQGMKPVGSGCVAYAFGKENRSPSVSNHFRADVTSEVSRAYLDIYKTTQQLVIYAFPFFKPMDYGQLDGEIRGRWVTAVDDRKMCDIVTVSPLPLSGWMLKRTLIGHEAGIRKAIAETNDGAEKQSLNEVLEILRSALREIPDGLADHVLCTAHVEENGVIMSTKLMDDEMDEGKSALNAGAVGRISQPATAKTAALSNGAPSQTAVARCRLAEKSAIADLAPYGQDRKDLALGGTGRFGPPWTSRIRPPG